MANENVNRSHASASLTLLSTTSASAIVVNNGFVPGSLVRQAVGEFTIGLIDKLDPLGGQVYASVASETPRIIAARIRPPTPGFPDEDITILTYDAAGVAADIGEVYIEVRRYPVQS